MSAFKGFGSTGNAAGVVTPLDHKLAQAAFVTKTTTPLLIRPGVFYAGNASLITGTAGMAYSVIAYNICTQRSAGAGVVFGGNDGSVSVATIAAPGSNSRIEIMYHWHREYSLDGVDSNPVIGVIQGTAAASPTAPSLAAFPGAIEIGRATVAAGAVATNGAGVTITQTAPFTSADGGIVVFRTTTEMNLWTTALANQKALDLSSLLTYTRTGAAWVRGDTASLQLDTTNTTPAMITQYGIGKIIGNGTTTINEVVTFPVAFGAGVTPVIVMTIAGTRATGAFNAAALSAGGFISAGHHTVSNTVFTARLDCAAASTLGASNDFYYTWAATGAL